MSRSFDVLLLGLVGGVGWWLFARADGPSAPVSEASPAHLVPTLEAPPARPPGPAEVPAPGAALAARAVTFEVDDLLLLGHPSLQLVVADGATGRLAPLAWQPTADGRVATALAPGQVALGLALVHPTLEVLAWLPLDPATGQPEELPVRLAERFVRIAFDVRDADGQVVHDARLSLRSAEPARTFDGARVGLPVDRDGKVLVPRRAGVRIDVWSARGTATVDAPIDGDTVQLAAR